MKIKKIYILEMADGEDITQLNDNDFVELAEKIGWGFRVEDFCRLWNADCVPSSDNTIMRVVETVDYGVLDSVLRWYDFDSRKFDESELRDIAEQLSAYEDPNRRQVREAVEYAIYGNGNDIEYYEI